MASPDFVIGYHKLDTEFFGGHVQHTTFHSDASQGRRRVAVVKNWYRGPELGRGSFGTVFLETSEEGERRAVKEIAKDKNSRNTIDYRRELMAMAILGKHDALFVQLLGWYDTHDYVHIAMEYISRGHLRHYLEVERSESEAKAVAKQLLEGLFVIHQEGFAHRDLKPENIFVVSTSPIWVKIGDFGLAKLARGGTAFRTQGGTRDYVAPEVGIDTSRETSEYTNAIDIWALGCITHEMLTRALPFRGLGELSSYCLYPKLPRNTMLSKNISKSGIEFVERALAYPPERRVAAKEALDLEWLRPEDKEMAGVETEDINRKTNEATRMSQNAEAVNDLKGRVEDWKDHKLEDFGELLLHGQFLLTKSDQKRDVGRECYIYLFGRVLLFCKGVEKDKKQNNLWGNPKPGKSRTMLQLRGRIFLWSVTNVISLARGGLYTLQVFWRGDSGLAHFVIKYTNGEELAQWDTTLRRQRELSLQPSSDDYGTSRYGNTPIMVRSASREGAAITANQAAQAQFVHHQESHRLQRPSLPGITPPNSVSLQQHKLMRLASQAQFAHRQASRRFQRLSSPGMAPSNPIPSQQHKWVRLASQAQFAHHQASRRLQGPSLPGMRPSNSVSLQQQNQMRSASNPSIRDVRSQAQPARSPSGIIPPIPSVPPSYVAYSGGPAVIYRSQNNSPTSPDIPMQGHP